MAGPRRLNSCTSRGCGQGPSARLSRKGAAEASAWACSGRKANSRPGCWAAQACRRRSCSGRAWGSQLSTALTHPDLSACSVAHRRSAWVWASTQIRRCWGKPARARPGRCGCCGGPISSTEPPWRTSWARAGPSRRHSPWAPGPCSTSVSDWQGQPPPGSSASSSGWPLAMRCSLPWPRAWPGQTAWARCEGRADRAAADTVCMYSIVAV
jgi:hypothetical protein